MTSCVSELESSAFQEQAAAADADNQLLWRYERHRAEAEVIRDSMLFVGGRLNAKMGGPGVYPPLPRAVSTGGLVHVLPRRRIPGGGPMAALFRF